MKIEMMASHPNEVELTMKLTMTMSDWLKLSEQCRHAYPGWKLTTAIAASVAKVKQSFSEEVVSD